VNGYRMVVCTPGLWPPVSAPYTVLREPLVAAEGWLNLPDTASTALWRGLAQSVGGEHQVIEALWRGLAQSVGGEHQVTEALDALLLVNVSGWRLTERDGCTKVMLAGRTELESGELAAV